MSDLADLYAIDPLTLTKDDSRLRAMVEGLRAQRAQFAQTEAAGQRPKATPRKAKEVKPVSLDELDLSGL